MTTLYHGSKDIIRTPEYGKGKLYNDYGLGFYCTENPDLAKEWAVDSRRNGFANIYEIDESKISVMRFDSPEYSILNWLAVLLENRQFNTTSPLSLEGKEYIIKNFMVDYRSYDAIVGYRADDSYFTFAQDFLSGTISLRQFSSAMHLGSLGLQFVLKSRKAFEILEFKGYEKALFASWYKKKENRDSAARRDYLYSDKNRRIKGDIFITQIIDEEMKNGDERLR